GAPRDREDHVGAVLDELLADRLALVLVDEALGEGAVLLRLVPAEDLDVLALLLVVVLDALLEAVHVHGHRRDLESAERRDLAGLGVRGSEVPAQEGPLRGVELDAVDVGPARAAV